MGLSCCTAVMMDQPSVSVLLHSVRSNLMEHPSVSVLYELAADRFCDVDNSQQQIGLGLLTVVNTR